MAEELILPSDIRWTKYIAGTQIHKLDGRSSLIKYNMNEYELHDSNVSDQPIKMNYKQLTEYLNEI